MRFKERQLSQMANHEIIVNVEHDKHDLSQNEASKEDKLKPGRLLTAPEMTLTVVALEAIAVHSSLCRSFGNAQTTEQCHQSMHGQD